MVIYKHQGAECSYKGDIMRKGFWKQLSYEDKFDRKYACWAVNHNGWGKRKRWNRRAARRALKRLNEERDPI